MVRDSRAVPFNTPEVSSSSAGGIERANYEVEKQIRTSRSRFEQNYGETVDLEHNILPCTVRHSAWHITH